MAHILIAGGAGFVGSHLTDALLDRGDQVTVVDDLSTGRTQNIDHRLGHPGLAFVEADVVDRTITAELGRGRKIDGVMHLASPASPKAYAARPIETLAAGSTGTVNLLDLAVDQSARFVLASTSEVYGTPAVHPQTENYFGNVNPVGPRSCYDEAKRFSEALTVAYRDARALDVGIARIFNTYGPRMAPDDGRVISNFIVQALSRAPLTVYGDGTQTRSFCYVSDLVRGLVALLDADISTPVNLGNPEERTIGSLAEVVADLAGLPHEVTFEPLPADDPDRRCPDIGLARSALGWEPVVGFDEGLRLTYEYFSAALGATRD